MIDELFHYGDIVRIAIDAGLADHRDCTEWLEAHGICAGAASQYADGMVLVAVEEERDVRPALRGVFFSGLTLGIALGEARRSSL